MSDLFADLHGSSRGEITKKVEDLEEQKRSLSAHIITRKNERSAMIERVKAARAAMRAITPEMDELRAKKGEIRQLQGDVNAARRNRDAVNQKIPLPYNRLTERDQVLRKKLVENRPDNPVELDDEIRFLKELLTLQAQIAYKKESNQYHQIVANGLERIGVLRQEISSSKKQHDERVESLAGSADGVKPADLSFRAIKKLSAQIDAMMKELKGMYDHQRQINRESGRLQAFIKHVLDGGGRKRNETRRLEQKVLSGETFGMEDLANLLKSGGIDQEKVSSKQNQSKQRGTPPPPKRRQQITPKRGHGRIGRIDPDKRR